MINQPKETDKTIRIKRLIYRSWHRGCKETDGVLGGYATTYLTGRSDDEITLFEQLLDEDDWDIWNWIIGKTEPKQAYSKLIQAIVSSTQDKR